LAAGAVAYLHPNHKVTGSLTASGIAGVVAVDAAAGDTTVDVDLNLAGYDCITTFYCPPIQHSLPLRTTGRMEMSLSESILPITTFEEWLTTCPRPSQDPKEWVHGARSQSPRFPNHQSKFLIIKRRQKLRSWAKYPSMPLACRYICRCQAIDKLFIGMWIHTRSNIYKHVKKNPKICQNRFNLWFCLRKWLLVCALRWAPKPI